MFLESDQMSLGIARPNFRIPECHFETELLPLVSALVMLQHVVKPNFKISL